MATADLANPRQTADTAVGYLTVPAVLVRLLLPFATLVAVYPVHARSTTSQGGGFVAGWCFQWRCCCNTSFQGTTLGGSASGAPPPLDWHWHARGPGHGAGALRFGYPFLTSPPPFTGRGWGEVGIASALFFDIGVFTPGGITLLITAIAHQSVRSHRFHARACRQTKPRPPEAASTKYNDSSTDGLTGCAHSGRTPNPHPKAN